MAALNKKVCLLGEFAVGKTSLVRRFVYNRFDDKYISTIGVKVSRKNVSVAWGSEVIDLTMMLWDLAGSEDFNQVRASYLRGSAGAIIVCDLTRRQTLMRLPDYVQNLRAVTSEARLVVVANKADLVDKYQFTAEELAQVAAQWDAPIYLTSAKIGDNVDDMFRQLAQMLVRQNRRLE